MSKKIKKIYLPKWQRYFVLPLLTGIWAFVLYMEFFSQDAGEMGTVDFVFFTGIFLLAGTMIYLMTTGHLPAYTMEEEVEEDDTDK